MEQKWIICIVPLIFLVCAGIVIEMIRGLLAGKRIRKVQKHRREEQCYYDAVKQREETLKKMQQEMKEYAAVMKAEGASANEESPQENDWLSAWLQQYQLRAEEKGTIAGGIQKTDSPVEQDRGADSRHSRHG